MTEILTESFCERCGTRYTFESARPKTRLKGVKVLSRGLKNFVLSDDTSMNEAMAAARSETDREATSHQLDAFHKTFSFCMSCRQYTCPNCWNGAEARCLSCAPLTIQEGPVALGELISLHPPMLDDAARGNGVFDHEHDDRPALIAPDAEEPPPVEATESAADPALKGTDQTASLLRRFRPGENLDAELAAFERARADAEVLAAEASVEGPAPTPELEPVDDVVGAAVEEVVTAAVDEVVAAAAEDVVEQPTWRITGPDAPVAPRGGTVPAPAGAETSRTGQPAAEASPTAEPQWPARPEWPGSTPTAGLPFLGRPAAGQGGIDALWAASNQELVAAPVAPGRAAPSRIQPCVSCGLSLSANARFCRRCGTVQER